MVQKDVIEKLENGVEIGSHAVMLENTCQLLSYVNDFAWAVQLSVDPSNGGEGPLDMSMVARPTTPSEGQERHLGGDDYGDNWGVDEVDDDDSGGEDSDDESLCNKLCTYTQTQKEFMNQHWYHCHTCKMVDGIGVCSICAKVCHADHDVTYSKYGSFFCDCGDKEDGSCKAMTRRTPQYSSQQQRSSSNQQTTSSRATSGSEARRAAAQLVGAQMSNFGLDAILPR